MTKKLLILAILVSISLVLSLPNSESTTAQESFAESEEVCPINITQQVIETKRNFYITLEQQMESADLTSERLYDIYQDFRTASADMRRQGSQRQALEGEVNIGEGLSENTSCESFTQDQVNEMEDVFSEYLSQVTVRTRNFLLLERYDLMNDDLQNLQESFHDVRTDLNTFHDQMPCFISQCLQN